MVTMESDKKEFIYIIVDKLECLINRHIYKKETERVSL